MPSFDPQRMKRVDEFIRTKLPSPRAPGEPSFEVDTIGDVVVVRMVGGSLQGTELGEVWQPILDRFKRPMVVLDFSDVIAISSTSLGTLLDGHRRIADRGGALVTANLPETIDVFFKSIRLNRLLKSYSNIEEAVSSLAEPE